MADLKIRYAVMDDNPIIYQLIKQLGEYENIADQYLATEEILFESLFIKKQAEVLIIEFKDLPIGYALFFNNFSTSLGKAGIYIEDIFILPEYRGKGYGKKVFKFIATTAKDRNCSRMEWLCLDWNNNAQRFYTSLGALKKEGWLVYRLDEEAINELAEK